MPRTATAKATKAKKAELRSAKAEQRSARLLADCERLANLDTLKHEKRQHRANFALFDAHAELRQLHPLWTQQEAGRLLFLKQRIQRGRCSDFPGMTHAEGRAELNNLALDGLSFQSSATSSAS